MISAWTDAKPKMRLAAAFAIIALAIAMLGSAAAKPALADEPLTIASQDSADGAIEPGDYYIQSALSGAYMLDISGGSRAANANAQIWSSNKTAAQRWHIARDADGTYTLRCTASDKYLGIAGKSPRNGTNVVQLVQNGAAARWAIAKSDSTYVLSPSAGPKLALDVAGGTHADGTNVQVYSANGTNAQKWRLIPAKPAVASSRTVANGVYELRFSAASA